MIQFSLFLCQFASLFFAYPPRAVSSGCGFKGLAGRYLSWKKMLLQHLLSALEAASFLIYQQDRFQPFHLAYLSYQTLQCFLYLYLLCSLPFLCRFYLLVLCLLLSLMLRTQLPANLLVCHDLFIITILMIWL